MIDKFSMISFINVISPSNISLFISPKICEFLKSEAKTKGAILIRNSWGAGWGDEGYGWLPYDYILENLARDWWSLIKAEWVDLGIFSL